MQALGVDPCRESAREASKLVLHSAATSEISIAGNAFGAHWAATGALSVLEKATASGAPRPGIVEVKHGWSGEVELNVQKEQVLDVNDVGVNLGDPLVAGLAQGRIPLALSKGAPRKIVYDPVDCGACAILVLGKPGALSMTWGSGRGDDVNFPSSL